MAEYLLRDRLGKGSNWTVASAGTMAGRGMGASRAGIQVLAERGIDLSPHRSRPLTAREVRQAEVIVVMAETHRQQVTHLYPDVAPNVFMLKHFDPGAAGDVEDPIGASSSMYRLIRDEIEAALPGLQAFLETLE